MIQPYQLSSKTHCHFFLFHCLDGFTPLHVICHWMIFFQHLFPPELCFVMHKTMHFRFKFSKYASDIIFHAVRISILEGTKSIWHLAGKTIQLFVQVGSSCYNVMCLTIKQKFNNLNRKSYQTTTADTSKEALWRYVLQSNWWGWPVQGLLANFLYCIDKFFWVGISALNSVFTESRILFKLMWIHNFI